MVNKELFAALRMLQKEKGISMDVLCEGIQRALVTAVKRDYNNKDIVFCELNPEDETMRVFVRKNVVSERSIKIKQNTLINPNKKFFKFHFCSMRQQVTPIAIIIIILFLVHYSFKHFF